MSATEPTDADLTGPKTTTRVPAGADVEVLLRRVCLMVHDDEIGLMSCDGLFLTDVEVEDGNVFVRLVPEDVPVIRAWLDRQEGGLCE